MFSSVGSHASHVLYRSLSAQCLGADGSYLYTAGTPGGSGLQFVKAVTLRATFYL